MTDKYNSIARAIYDAKKNLTTIKANIRLKKNGHFSSIEGQVKDIKVSRDGYAYLIIHPKNKKKHVQTVILSNVMSVYYGDELIKA